MRKITLTREQIEKYQQRPVEVSDVEKEAVKLCCLIEKHQKDCPQEIATLAHQLLVQAAGWIKERTETELVNNEEISPATRRLLRASEIVDEDQPKKGT